MLTDNLTDQKLKIAPVYRGPDDLTDQRGGTICIYAYTPPMVFLIFFLFLLFPPRPALSIYLELRLTSTNIGKLRQTAAIRG